jgi:hypothetical protein
MLPNVTDVKIIFDTLKNEWNKGNYTEIAVSEIFSDISTYPS